LTRKYPMMTITGLHQSKKDEFVDFVDEFLRQVV
jgi:hypothetical protein